MKPQRNFRLQLIIQEFRNGEAAIQLGGSGMLFY